MTKEYKLLEEGFVKKSVELGCEEGFIRGYLKEAQDMTDAFAELISEAEYKSGDPGFRAKLGAEIILLGNVSALEKSAEGFMDTLQHGLSSAGNSISGGLNDMGINQQSLMKVLERIGGVFGKNHGSGLGGTIAGGGGGALIGLALAKALGLPSWAGMMLSGIGGVGGGMLGKSYGEGAFGQLPSMHSQEANGTAVPGQPGGGGEPPAAAQTRIGGSGSDPEGDVPKPNLGTPVNVAGKSITPQQTQPQAPQQTQPQAPQQTQPQAPQQTGIQAPPMAGAGMPKLRMGSPNPGVGSPMHFPSAEQGVKPQHIGMDNAPSMFNPKQGNDQLMSILQNVMNNSHRNNPMTNTQPGVAPSSHIEYGKPYNINSGAYDHIQQTMQQHPQMTAPPKVSSGKFSFNVNGQTNVPTGGSTNSTTTPNNPPPTSDIGQAPPGPNGFPGSNIGAGMKAQQQQMKAAIKG